MANLNEAVQLIRQGHKDEARRILEPILKANPQDIQAWFWYVETCSSPEQRVKTLEVCLKLNPGNPQALRALRALQSRAENPPATLAEDEIPDWARRPAQELAPASQTIQHAPAFSVDEPEAGSFLSPVSEAPHTGWQQPRGESKPAFDWDALEQESAAVGQGTSVFQESLRQEEPKSQPRGKSLLFYQVWWQAVSAQSVAGYAVIFDDPDAGAGRGFEWIAYTSVLTGLLSPFVILANPQFTELNARPEFQQIIGRVGSMTMLMAMLGLGLAILTPLVSIIGLAINAGIYHLLAVLFGGKGTFGRMAYALAAYMAPLSIITTLVNIIPVVGSCLAAPLGIYSIVLNVRALMASHDLSVGRALGVIFLPGILIFISCCLLGILLPDRIPSLLGAGY